MVILIAFAFLAGVVTILSPCILPILPIILSSTIGGQSTGKTRPFGVVIGFILSFTLFTLFLSTIVRLSGVPANSLRFVSVLVIGLFGASLIIPQFQVLVEKLFSKLAGFMPSSKNRVGFGGGLLIGLSVGLLWTPCVGPILASVISLAITGSVTFDAFLITFAYAIGTAIPMFLIMLGGQNTLRRVPWLLANLSKIQKLFGVLMILTAIGIFFNVDRQFQTYILNAFPKYGMGLTKFEDNILVKKKLEEVNQKGERAPEIIPGGIWFNSKPLRLEQLKGKVVIIDFWTYTCINCQRTFPYLRRWHEKYKDKGLVIIGVHSPEFEFEKNEKNVAQAIKDFDLSYPIVQDNDFATWRAFNNRYWPAKYFIDKEGFIRYTHFGEGDYDESEKIIQELLKETGAKDVTSEINNPIYQVETKTQETYLGSSRNPYKSGFTVTGDWNFMEEYANSKKGAQLLLNFDAKEVFLVMRNSGKPAKIKVYLDDKLQYFGADNNNGIVTVNTDRLYKLINLPTPGPHTLRLEFEDSNAQLFAFTFG